MRYFVALATTLNFTEAARQLHITQPPLSRQIRQLEEELGVSLIDRNARPLALTRAGAFFYEQARQILAQAEELKLATQRFGSGRQRWIGVGFVPSMLYSILPDVIHQFMAENPEVDVNLSELTSVQQAEALLAGRIDIGFGRLNLQTQGLAFVQIQQERLVAVLPAQLASAGHNSIKLAELARHTVILYPAAPRPSFADQVLAQFRAADIQVPRQFETNGLQTAIGLVAAGIGVTVVPQSVQRLQRDEVVYKEISDSSLVSPILMMTRSGDGSADVARLCHAVTRAGDLLQASLASSGQGRQHRGHQHQ